MSVANSLILLDNESQAAQIDALTAQVAALSASVSANSAQVATNLSNITALAFADQQAFVVKSIPNSGVVYNDDVIEVLFEDPPEVGISGNYVFKLTGLLETGSAETISSAQIEILNTEAGVAYDFPLAGTGATELTFSYTGFVQYITGGALPKLSIVAIITNSGQWGYAQVSLTYYRVQQLPNP